MEDKGKDVDDINKDHLNRHNRLWSCDIWWGNQCSKICSGFQV